MSEFNNISEIGNRAIELNKEGYSCSQSVFGALCERCGVDQKTGMQLSSGFCGGMGGLKEVCGAFSSLVLLTSLKHGYSEAVNPEAKSAQNAIIKKAAERFIAENGSLLCREIAPNDEAKKTNCPKAIAAAAMLAEEIIGSEELDQRMHLKPGKCGHNHEAHHAEGEKCCHNHGEHKEAHHAEGEKCCHNHGEGRKPGHGCRHHGEDK